MCEDRQAEVDASHVRNFDLFGTYLVVTLRTCLQVEKKLLEPLPSSGFRAQAWNIIFDAQRLNLCRSAVGSRLKRGIELGKVLTVCVEPPSGATCMRAQRVALALFASFFAKQGVSTALVQPGAPLLWQAPTCHAQLDLCQFWTQKIGDPPVSCWLAWIPVTPKSSATLAMVSISLARAQAQLTAKQVNQFRADCQLIFVTLWYKCSWQSHMPDCPTISPPF